MLLVDITSRGAGLFGSRTAVRTSDGAQTYRQLHAGVCGLIDLLATAGGVGRGTRLAILAPNGIVFLQAVFAASWLGAVVVPLNTRLSPDDIRFQLDDAEVRHGLIDPALSELARASGLLERTHWPTGDALVDALAGRSASVEELIASGVVRSALPTDPVVQPYTSGTTGRPKGCLLTQAGWLAANANVAHRFSLVDSDVLLGVYPLFHVAGLGLAMAHLMVGGSVVFPDGADPEALWSAIERHSVTVAGLPGLPAALERPGAGTAGRSLRILFGGANMESAHTLRRVGEVLLPADDARFAEAAR